jgi:hypothetical protein
MKKLARLAIALCVAIGGAGTTLAFAYEVFMCLNHGSDFYALEVSIVGFLWTVTWGRFVFWLGERVKQ